MNIGDAIVVAPLLTHRRRGVVGKTARIGLKAGESCVVRI